MAEDVGPALGCELGDGRDNLIETTYPGGREVVQDYDAANRIVRVWDRAGTIYARGAQPADAMTSHANGIVASYTAGNGLTHATTLTDNGRQWVRTIDAAPLAVTYGYDVVGA